MKITPRKQVGRVRGNAGIPSRRPTFHRVLATTDFSDASQSGVRYAVAFAQKLGAAVALLHVIEPPSRLAGMEAVGLTCGDSELADLAGAQLKELAQRESKKGLRLTTLLRVGKPFDEICAAAESVADLIVLATHGYTGAQRVLLGSTAERVVRHAPCPVLTVRQPPPPPPGRKKHPASNSGEFSVPLTSRTSRKLQYLGLPRWRRSSMPKSSCSMSLSNFPLTVFWEANS